MSHVLRAAGVVAGISVLGLCGAAPSGAQTQAADTRPPCRHALVAMEDNVDSAHAKSGDVFRFQLVETATAADGTLLPVGTPGYGVVANSSHAERGGRAGYLALEARFFVLGDRHVPAIIDRFNDNASSAVGATGNAPGLLGLIPIVGYAVGGYDSLHHGKDATIPRGTRVGVFIGDDAALGTCRPPAAGETPPPVASPAPSPSPSPAPSASPH